MSSYADQLDATGLVTAILEKTRVGKLKWEETASDVVFIASVGGDTTLKVSRYDSGGSPPYYQCTLSLLDENGKLLWEIEQPERMLDGLFTLARRVALRVDEKVDALLNTLQKL